MKWELILHFSFHVKKKHENQRVVWHRASSKDDATYGFTKSQPYLMWCNGTLLSGELGQTQPLLLRPDVLIFGFFGTQIYHFSIKMDLAVFEQFGVLTTLENVFFV